MGRTSLPKHRPYWAELFRKAWEDVELVEVISEAGGGIVIAYIFLTSGVAPADEKLELYCEAVAFAFVVPLIAFLIRLFFVTPARLYAELSDKVEKSGQNQKSPQIDTLPPKESHVIGFLLFLCACFALVLIIENTSCFSQKKPSKLIMGNAYQSPIPDKSIQPSAIILSNGQPSVASTRPLKTIQPIQFETNSPTTEMNDSENELAVLRIKKLAEIESKRKSEMEKRQSDSDQRLAKMLPFYKDCIEAFYGLLKKQSDKRQEGLAKTVNYFSCLPASMDVQCGETNVAEIKFQNQTNVDFRILLTKCDFWLQRGLKIEGSAGWFEIKHHNVYVFNTGVVEIHLNGIDDSREVSLDDAQKTHSLLAENLKLLIDTQIALLPNTNSQSKQ